MKVRVSRAYRRRGVRASDVDGTGLGTGRSGPLQVGDQAVVIRQVQRRTFDAKRPAVGSGRSSAGSRLAEVGLSGRQVRGQPVFQLGDLSRVTRLQRLHLVNVPLLVPTLLEERGRADVESQDQGVAVRVEVALRSQQVQPEEAVVAPALADFEIRGELAHHVLGGVRIGVARRRAAGRRRRPG